MDALITFLRARLDEAEVEANSHYNLRSDGPRNIDSRPRGDVLLVSIEGGPEKEMSHKQYVEAFMVPKPDEKLLAQVNSQRQIIELHDGEHECREMHEGTYAADWPSSAPYGSPGAAWRHASSEHFEAATPCPTLLLLALPFDGHPDYREDWKPT